MAVSASSISPSQAAPAADGKPISSVTNGTTKENSFSSALQDQLLNGAAATPTAGQTVLSTAGKGGKTGQNSPDDGKDLPLVLTTDASSTVIVPIPPVAVNGVIPPNADGTATSVTSSGPAPLVGAGANIAISMNAAIPPVAVNGVIPPNADGTATSVTSSGQESKAFSATDIFKAAMQGGNQSAFMLSSNSRSGANVTSNADASKSETTNNSTGMATGSDDTLSTMLDKIMLVRETTSAASGQGASSSTTSAVVRDNVSPAQQQALTQPYTDLMASSRDVPSHSTSVAVPVNQPGWDQALGERVHWLVTQRFQTAEIHLNPPELGPVEVRLSMDHDQAQIQFFSPHASVRDAIEAALPRLREMMGDGGVQLMNVDVGQHSAERQSHFQTDFGAAHRGPAMWSPGTNGEDDTILSASTTAVPALGLVDYYI
jgi:flagellar hook-length control protein FliK